MTNVHDWDIMEVIVMQLLLKRNFCLLPPLWAILITTSIHNSIIWVSGRKHHKRIRITVKMTWIENALKSLSLSYPKTYLMVNLAPFLISSIVLLLVSGNQNILLQSFLFNIMKMIIPLIMGLMFASFNVQIAYKLRQII